MSTAPTENRSTNQPSNAAQPPAPVISVAPVVLSAPGRGMDLPLRVSAPVTGSRLPIVVFAHGFASSMDGYAPLASYWAARGFVVIQPTFLDSRTLTPPLPTSHSEAVKAYLDDPRKLMMWRYRVEDMRRILDELDLIAEALPGLGGRLDRSRVAVAGHSFGAQTAAAVLGARVVGADGRSGEDYTDARIKAGVLLSAGGRGGDALSPFAREHFPHLDQSYAGMTTPTLVVAGDQDRSSLTVLGPEWFADAYTLSPGTKCLVTLFGAEHMLGGISGYQVTETTDESPARVAAVQRLTWAYLRSTLYPEDTAWSAARAAWSEPNALGSIVCKQG